MALLWVYFHFLEWSKFFATLLTVTVRVRIWVNVIIRVKVGMLALHPTGQTGTSCPRAMVYTAYFNGCFLPINPMCIFS